MGPAPPQRLGTSRSKYRETPRLCKNAFSSSFDFLTRFGVDSSCVPGNLTSGLSGFLPTAYMSGSSAEL
jgi:hypothetical protein